MPHTARHWASACRIHEPRTWPARYSLCTQPCSQASSGLRLQARFEAIEDKLKLVQENLKYFLEIMQHKKSDALEWTVRLLVWLQHACYRQWHSPNLLTGAGAYADYHIDCRRNLCLLV